MSNSGYFSIQFTPLGYWPQQTVQDDINKPMVVDSIPDQSAPMLVDSPSMPAWLYAARDQHTDISPSTSPQFSEVDSPSPNASPQAHYPAPGWDGQWCVTNKPDVDPVAPIVKPMEAMLLDDDTTDDWHGMFNLNIHVTCLLIGTEPSR